MSKNRFLNIKKRKSPNVISILAGLVCIAFLVFQADGLNKTTRAKEKESIEQAITRNAVHCYATTGRYPQDIQYIKENYGLVYDEDKYLVNYNIFASNIMPDITVIERRG